MDVIDILAQGFICIDYLVICPILVYFVYKFKKYSASIQPKYKDIIKNRSKTLIYLINIVIIFTLLFERTFLLCSKVWIAIDLTTSYSWIVYLFLSSTWTYIMILFIIKVYHLYYKQQYNTSIANVSWRKDINPDDKDWYISHKLTFGNTIFCIKISIIPYIFIVVIETITPILVGMLCDLST